MADRDNKVIGYFAYLSPMQVACDGEACVIAGSEEAMRRYLSISNPENAEKHTIKKTRFREITKGTLSANMDETLTRLEFSVE